MVSFDTSELLALAADLDASGSRVGGKIADAVRTSASRVERAAKAAAPKRTGALAGSIGTKLHGDGRAAGITAVVSTSLRYAHFNEYGTAKMRPQPYMEPAFLAESPALTAAIEAAVEEAIG